MHPSARDYSLLRDAPHAAVSGLRTDCGRDLDQSLARAPAWRHVLRLMGIAVLLVAMTDPCIAQEDAQQTGSRIPHHAHRGVMSPGPAGTVLLDGNPALLSAAVIIRNANNLIITSNALPPDSLVRFLKEPSGTIFRVWILTPAEAEASRPSIFDFMRQNGQR